MDYLLSISSLANVEVDASSSIFEWVIFLAYKYWNLFVEGTKVTLYVAVIGTIAGFILGFLIGIIQNMRLRAEDGFLKKCIIRLLKFIVGVYVEVFRGTPMIVQAMIIYYGLREGGMMVTPVTAGVMVTVFNTGAYMAETVRAGINSVDNGQEEGALALGMSPLKAMIYVILPQAFRNIIPEMGNTFLTNLKMTSVLNVIGVSELFLMAKTAGGTYYRYFEAYMVIGIIYLVLSIVFDRLIKLLEKKMEGKKDYVLAVEYLDND